MSAWSMLRLLKEDPSIIKQSQKTRGLDARVVDRALDLDMQWRQGLTELNELRQSRNRVSREIGKFAGSQRLQKIREAKELTELIKTKEEETTQCEKERGETLKHIPNIAHETVPLGSGEADNVVIKLWGRPKVWNDVVFQSKTEQPKTVMVEHWNFKPNNHVDLAKDLVGTDTERGAKVAGSRFYYLLNDLVWMNYALQVYALSFLSKKGFTLVEPPPMIKETAYSGVTSLSDFRDSIYKIEGEDLFLIATSEHPIAALHMNEVLAKRDLPLKYAGSSPCYRREAGAHGKDTKGIFRVHHFVKIEQFIFCLPEQSWDLHQELIDNAEKLFQGLGLPYRVVNICGGELGAVAAKKFDIEVWMPGAGEYREVVSCSNCLDWQSARLNIRYSDQPGNPSEGYVHTLNSTAMATSRTITAILENYQQKDGTVEVPKILQPYLELMMGSCCQSLAPRRRK